MRGHARFSAARLGLYGFLAISALFFLGYDTFRFVCEFFREPDTQFIGPVSMGMALSSPIWLTAGALFVLSVRTPRRVGHERA